MNKVLNYINGLTLIGSRPGVGKSSLAFNIMSSIKDKDILFLSFEESKSSIESKLLKISDSINNIHIDDSPNMNIDEVITTIRNNNYDIVVIDYIQLVRNLDNKNILKELKDLANELGITIIVLSQLSREVEGRIPLVSDLSFDMSYVDNTLLLYKDLDKVNISINDTNTISLNHDNDTLKMYE